MLNENQKIWRYLAFWKFESMLEKKAIFFQRQVKCRIRKKVVAQK